MAWLWLSMAWLGYSRYGLAVAMAWLWLWLISKLHCAHRDLIRTNGIFDVLRQTLTAATDQEA